MKKASSLKEAKVKFKELCWRHVDFDRHSSSCDCGLRIFHKVGSQTWWIGTEMDWLNK